MQFFVFRSFNGSSAISTDEAGANLPFELAPWVFTRNLEIDEGLEPPIELMVPEVLRILDRQGFYIVPPDIEMEDGDRAAT